MLDIFLTTAYILIFLAETKINMLSEGYMSVLNSSIAKNGQILKKIYQNYSLTCIMAKSIIGIIIRYNEKSKAGTKARNT